MASTASHFSLSLSIKQAASSTTPKLNTHSSLLHCFQSSKFLSPRYSLALNLKCVSMSSAGQGRSIRACADLGQVTEHEVPTIVEVDVDNFGCPYPLQEFGFHNGSYPIYIGSGLLDKPELLQRQVQGERVLVLTNNTIAPLYLDKVVDALTRGNPNISVESFIFPDGEQYKYLNTETELAKKSPRFGQKATYVALGGGVICDMCGYEAAPYLSGVNFIQIPTTVTAQVDSSVSGKARTHYVSRVLGLIKDMATAFRPPHCVLIDTDTLNTLPDRELSSGFAEVIKYGLIRDALFFEWLEKNMQALMARDPSALAYAIKRSCENKAEVVSWHEKESVLNLGHTFGYAIEETSVGDVQWLHGEAVAAGMVMAVDLSRRLGWIDDSIVQRVHAILKQANLPTAPPENMTVDTFKSLIVMDKKGIEGFPGLVLPRGPLGNCVFTRNFDKKALDATLHKFCKS